jgi:hypothetical protein
MSRPPLRRSCILAVLVIAAPLGLLPLVGCDNPGTIPPIGRRRTAAAVQKLRRGVDPSKLRNPAASPAEPGKLPPAGAGRWTEPVRVAIPRSFLPIETLSEDPVMTRFRNPRAARRGFTLIELLVLNAVSLNDDGPGFRREGVPPGASDSREGSARPAPPPVEARACADSGSAGAVRPRPRHIPGRFRRSPGPETPLGGGANLAQEAPRWSTVGSSVRSIASSPQR